MSTLTKSTFHYHKKLLLVFSPANLEVPVLAKAFIKITGIREKMVYVPLEIKACLIFTLLNRQMNRYIVFRGGFSMYCGILNFFLSRRMISGMS